MLLSVINETFSDNSLSSSLAKVKSQLEQCLSNRRPNPFGKNTVVWTIFRRNRKKKTEKGWDTREITVYALRKISESNSVLAGVNVHCSLVYTCNHVCSSAVVKR